MIGTNVGGIKDIIKDGRTGILVEPKNPEEIAIALIKIHSQPQFAQGLVNNVMTELPKYDWQNIAEKVHKIYQRVTL